MFDILCRQPDSSMRLAHSARLFKGSLKGSREGSDILLDFDCDNFFCLGSPIALFQMLKGRTIAGRKIEGSHTTQTPMDPDDASNLFSNAQSSPVSSSNQNTAAFRFSNTVSSPKCEQLFNIFHPSDPISYRIEPLISPMMSSLKPQPLPFVKRIICAASGQGLTNISARVGLSMESLWANFTSGVASNFLNRSLGLTSEEASTQSKRSQDVEWSPPVELQEITCISHIDSQNQSHKFPVLIDSQLETLCGDHGRMSDQLQGTRTNFETSLERKLRNEEANIRALNSNGRVDYSIQEGVFDISLIASIASHLSYWADEDVNHFVISQLLSNTRRKQEK
jgi:hypothetical protein